jgi:hypothetical protein
MMNQMIPRSKKIRRKHAKESKEIRDVEKSAKAVDKAINKVTRKSSNKVALSPEENKERIELIFQIRSIARNKHFTEYLAQSDLKLDEKTLQRHNIDKLKDILLQIDEVLSKTDTSGMINDGLFGAIRFIEDVISAKSRFK